MTAERGLTAKLIQDVAINSDGAPRFATWKVSKAC
jgi:hypothetical protein